MQHRIRKPLTRGVTDLYNLPDRRLKRLSFGIITLRADDRFGETLNKREAVLVLLHGTIYLHGQTFDFGEIKGRKTVFDGETASIYCPPGIYSIKARTDCALAVLRGALPQNIKPEEPRIIEDQEIRKETSDDGCVRTYTFLDHSGEASGLVVGEALFDAGSKPCSPARVLIDVLDGNSDGVAFFCLPDGEGEARATVSNAENGTETTLDLRDADTVILPMANSVSVDPAGRPLYCLWGMTRA